MRRFVLDRFENGKEEVAKRISATICQGEIGSKRADLAYIAAMVCDEATRKQLVGLYKAGKGEIAKKFVESMRKVGVGSEKAETAYLAVMFSEAINRDRPTMFYKKGVFYWRNSVYAEALGKEAVKDFLTECLDKCTVLDLKKEPAFVDLIYKRVKFELSRRSVTFDNFKSSKKVVNLKDAVLEVDDSNVKVRPREKDEIFDGYFDFKYDADAKSRSLEWLLNTYVPEPEYKALLQEYAGANLVDSAVAASKRASIFQKLKECGKAFVAEVLRSLLGLPTVTASQAASMVDALDLPFLIKKDESAKKDLVLLPNGPEKYDVLLLPKDALSEELKTRLPKKLSESELSGILNWALEGLKRLATDNESVPPKEKETGETSILTFLKERNYKISVLESNFIDIRSLYRDYASFCDERNLYRIRLRDFVFRMKALGFVEHRVNGKYGFIVRRKKFFG